MREGSFETESLDFERERGLEGKLIVIDGSDGSGKTEQTKRLIDRLWQEGYSVKTVSFPRYGYPAASDVEKYLTGKMGPKESIEPMKVAGFYAADRADFAPVLKKWLDDGHIVVSNRYTTSNVGHQSIRYPTWEMRDLFVEWLLDYEYNQLGIPLPDATIICHVPYEAAARNIIMKDAGRSDRNYLQGKKTDIHEKDRNHLMNAIEAYHRYAQTLPGWHLVECALNGDMLCYADIHNSIWKIAEQVIRQ